MMSERNKQNTADLIVSVESRKGGVGKTTAALCLGRLLQKRGYAVLILDLDVTGTNAADVAGSPFWVKDIHTIRNAAGIVHNSNVVPPPVNLLTLFERGFMAGKGAPSFSLSETDPEGMYVDLTMANLLGSQIYKTDKPKGEGNGGQTNHDKGTTCIERPGILFDDLYSHWLLEFVKHIIGDFVRVAASSGHATTAIILDNSPGYVGIAPAIHGWLTDCGPVSGKFLTVSSLDAQDLHACERAIDALHSLFTSKWETSRLFVDGADHRDGIRVAKHQEAFFMQLATSAKGRHGNDDALAFYRSPKRHRSEAKAAADSGSIYRDHPAKYIAAIVNRVPRAVKSGRLEYDISSVPVQRNGTFGQLLGAGERGQVARDRMVSYDEYIENQFLLQFMQRGRRRSERRFHRLVESLDMAEHELRDQHGGDGNGSARILRLDPEHFEGLKRHLLQTSDVVSRARSAVDDAGLGHLARLIHDEWLPGSIVPCFRSALMGLLRESDIPYFKTMRTDTDSDQASPATHDFIVHLKQRIVMEVRESPMRKPMMADERTVDLLANVLSGLVGLSFTSPMWHDSFQMEIADLFAGVLAVELNHWTSRGKERQSRSSVERFLAQEAVKGTELKEDEMALRHSRFFRHHRAHEEEGSFADFYKACTSAQARLIDFAADAQFLIRLMQFIVKGETEGRELFPFVRGIAEEVIVEKTRSHEDAPQQMAKALMAAEYFREFDGVLARTLSDWGVADA